MSERSKPRFWSRERRSFLYRKLFSLTGVLPVGVFLVLHLATYSRALSGKQSFDGASGDGSAPYLWVVEGLFIWLPLLYHAAYGIKLTVGARPSVARYPFTRNWMYALQRVSGLVALAFIVFHLFEYRIPLALGKVTHADLFQQMCATMSSTSRWGIPLVALAYLIGIAACTFHLTNGLSGICSSWGITTSERATRLAAGVFGVVGIALFVIGANTVIYFATGSRLGWSAHDPTSGAEPLTCSDFTGEHAHTALREASPNTPQPTLSSDAQ